MKKYKKILAASSALTVGIAGLHCANRMISRHACKDELLYCQGGKQYLFRFGKVFYTRQGSGHPVLLIHQLHPAFSHFEFKAITKELSSHYTVYALDLLGCGRSEKPAITYTAYLYVQLIQDFIKNVIGEETHVVVSENSVPLVLLACLGDPSLFGKMILVNPPSLSMANGKLKVCDRLLKNFIDLPVIGTFFYNMEMSKKKLARLLEKEVFYIPPSGELSNHLLREKKKCASYLYESSHLNGYGGKYLYSSIKTGYLNAYQANAVKQIDHSIYLIMGEHVDGCFDIISEYKKLNSAIETAIYPNTKKAPYLEAPKKILETIDIFFH